MIEGLVERPALRSRNDVGYMTLRSWRKDDRKAQIAAMKAEKAAPVSPLVDEAAREIVDFLGKYVPVPDAVVTSVPCGHSRRPDCFGKRLAQAVAAEVGLPFVQAWGDRFCEGVSHPKENSRLPPLTWESRPATLTIVIDDIATSGWHLEEAVTALRSIGVPAIALAWIGGSVGEGRNSRQQIPDGPGDGEGDRPRSPFGRGGRVWRMSGR